MKIAITGAPGSNHGKIAKTLADRLILQYISAKDLLTGNIPRKQRTEQFDLELNKLILQEGVSNDDYVLDAMVSFNIPDTIKIYLDRDMTEEVMYPQSMIEDYILDNKFKARFLWEDDVDIYINRTTISDEMVIDTIIKTLVSGQKRTLLPLSLCIPESSIINVLCNIDSPIKTVQLRKYNNLYIITNYTVNKYQSTQSLLVDVDTPIVQVDSYDIKHPAVYVDWLNKFKRKDLLNLNILLNRYCGNQNLEYVYTSYAKLMHNGNALQKLMLST